MCRDFELIDILSHNESTSVVFELNHVITYVQQSEKTPEIIISEKYLLFKGFVSLTFVFYVSHEI